MNSQSIRSSIQTVRRITQTVANDTTVLESLRNKVDEIMILKETNASLEMQLKVEKEANRLQSAEFAFLEQEYIAEIASLKENLENFHVSFKNSLDLSSNHRYYEVDVLLKTEKEKSAKLLEKVSKWKSKAKSLIELVDKLKVKIEVLENQKKQNSQEKNNNQKKFEKDHTEYKEKVKGALESKDRLFEELKQESEIEIKKLQIRIKELMQQISENSKIHANQLENQESILQDKLKGQINRCHKEKENLAAKAEDLKNENDKLHDTVKRLSMQLKDTEKQIFDLKNINKQNDFDRDFLIKKLNIVANPIGQEWESINEKISELHDKSKKADKLSKENEFLRKRLNSATEEIKRKTSSNSSSNEYEKETEDDELVKSLQTSLHHTQDELERNNNIVTHLRTRLRYAKIIDQHQVHVLKAFSDLHESITHNEPMCFRGLIIAVIFAKKFLLFEKNGHGKNDCYDPKYLAFYRGRLCISYDKKISEIRQKFSDMEHDFIFMKQNMEDIQNEAKRIAEEKANNEKELVNKISPIAEKQIQQLKQKVDDLTKELDKYVSLDKYNKVHKCVEGFEKANNLLKEEVERLSKLLEKRNNRHKLMKNKFREYILSAEHHMEVCSSTTCKCDEMAKEISSLKSLLRERTKEILALERLVNRHSTISTTTFNSCANAMAENEQLNKMVEGSFDGFCESPKCKELRGKGIMISINPEFLGNRDCCCC